MTGEICSAESCLFKLIDSFDIFFSYLKCMRVQICMRNEYKNKVEFTLK